MPKRKSSKDCMIKPWLSAKPDCKEGRFIQIGNSLLLDKRFQALKPTAKILYLCMAMESGGRREFTFPKTDMSKYGLSRSTAVTGVNALIEAGFIKKAYSGKITREPNGYEFCLEWKLNPPSR